MAAGPPSRARILQLMKVHPDPSLQNSPFSRKSCQFSLNSMRIDVCPQSCHHHQLHPPPHLPLLATDSLKPCLLTAPMLPLLHDLQSHKCPPGQQDSAPAPQGPRPCRLLPAQERHRRGHPEGVCQVRPRDVERTRRGPARGAADRQAQRQGGAQEETDA